MQSLLFCFIYSSFLCYTIIQLIKSSFRTMSAPSGNIPSSPGRRLWKIARNGVRTLSESGPPVPYRVRQIRGRSMPSEYPRLVNGQQFATIDANEQQPFNERLIDDRSEERKFANSVRNRSALTETESQYGESVLAITSAFGGIATDLSREKPDCPQISASIRLGSSYLSVGYGWVNKEGKCFHRILDNWTGCSHCPGQDRHRTSSEILLSVKPKEEIIAFGYEAHKIYLEKTPRQRKTLILKSNLADLFEQPPTNRVPDSKDVMELDRRSLCVHTIRHLQQAVLNDLKRNHLLLPIYHSRKISWTVVVDSEAAKKNVLQILPEVFITNCRVVLRRDTTACAVAEKMAQESIPSLHNSFKQADGPRPISKPTGRKKKNHLQSFILLNVGTSTTEVSLVKVSGNIVDPSTSQIGSFGGQTVSHGFYQVLINVFGAKTMETYKKENYEGNIDLMCAIEKAKRAVQVNKNISLHLPFSFCHHFQKKFGSRRRLDEATRRLGYRFNSSSNAIVLEPATIRAIFLSVVNNIIGLLESVLMAEECAVDIPLYLSGGFGQSSMFQTLLRETLPNRKFISIERPEILPLTGAMSTGFGSVILPGFCKTLQSLFTVGITAAAHCKSENKKASLAESLLCHSFVPFFKKDEYLSGKNHFAIHRFFAASPTQDSIGIRVFCTDHIDMATVCDESAMECVSQMQLHVPLEKRGIITGRLFIFQVLLAFVHDPPGFTVTVKDSDGIPYGSCRIVRKVFY